MRKNEKCVPNSDNYFPSMTLNVAQKLNEEVHSAHCIRVSVAITQSYGKKIHTVRDPLIESGYSSYETYHSGSHSHGCCNMETFRIFC